MRLLLVEDAQALAQTLALGFEEQGFTVDLAYDGELGAVMALEPIYDLIILDIMLPRKNGLEILSQLRQARCETPVLMLTARGELSDRVKGLNAGADDYLPKPFDFEELLARSLALIRRSKHQPFPVLALADLLIDTHTEQVTRQGERLSLTAREYQLLRYLAYNQERVITRSEIVDHLPDMSSDSNLIDVYIRRLRQKIDVPYGGPRLLHTIRGRGYLLGVSV